MVCFYAVVIGFGFGLVAGWTAEHVPSPPVVQSVVAFLIALILTNVSMLLYWTRRQSTGGFYGFGVENVVYLGIACIVAAVVHAILGRVDAEWSSGLGNYRAVALGCAGGLWGALSTAWALAGFERASRGTGGT